MIEPNPHPPGQISEIVRRNAQRQSAPVISADTVADMPLEALAGSQAAAPATTGESPNSPTGQAEASVEPESTWSVRNFFRRGS